MEFEFWVTKEEEIRSKSGSSGKASSRRHSLMRKNLTRSGPKRRRI